jgi:hypothetical protein
MMMQEAILHKPFLLGNGNTAKGSNNNNGFLGCMFPERVISRVRSEMWFFREPVKTNPF